MLYTGHLSMPYTFLPLAPLKCHPPFVTSRNLFSATIICPLNTLNAFLGIYLECHSLLDPVAPFHLSRYYPAFKDQTNTTSLRKPPLLSLPLELMVLLFKPLAWQFTDCHYIYDCLILLLTLQGCMPCLSYLTVSPLSEEVSSSRTIPTR